MAAAHCLYDYDYHNLDYKDDVCGAESVGSHSPGFVDAARRKWQAEDSVIAVKSAAGIATLPGRALVTGRTIFVIEIGAARALEQLQIRNSGETAIRPRGDSQRSPRTPFPV